MNHRLENQLREDFAPWFEALRNPELFRPEAKRDVYAWGGFKNYAPPLTWGIECDDGWYDLIHNMCTAIKMTNDKDLEEFRVIQVKEKFGTLRFYPNFASGQINKIINEAERESAYICEMCGSRDKVTTDGTSWVKTLCAVCRSKPLA